MKKDKKIFILMTIIIILLIICIILFIHDEFLDDKDDFSYRNPSYINDYITKDEALNIALNNINLNRVDVYDIDIELENKYNIVVYEVDFDYQGFEYEYYINAKTGEIVKSFSQRDY